MRPLIRVGIPFILMAVACESPAGPTAPRALSALQASLQPGTRTRVYPNMDGSFGPAVLASCDQGYDLIFQFKGTVTVIEKLDQTGNIIELQNVWNLTISIANSVTGYTVTGPSYGPDRTTLNSDGTSRLIQYGLLLHLRLPDGTQLIDVGTVDFFIDQNGGITLVGMHGPHPDHEGFPERPVLCALLNH